MSPAEKPRHKKLPKPHEESPPPEAGEWRLLGPEAIEWRLAGRPETAIEWRPTGWRLLRRPGR